MALQRQRNRTEFAPELTPPHLPTLEELVASDPAMIPYYYTEADIQYLLDQDPDLQARLTVIDENREDD